MAENTEKKTRITAGADELTPSHPQYFSWINNTNEGSSEEQTLINLEYFKYLYDTYGMRLDIYAWDAGNLDGARGTYEKLDSEKLRSQYPNGYAPVTRKAKEINTRLGVWCGPDGFGDTPKSAQERIEQMVSLCRDYNFALFKIDGVCGELREEKRGYFVEMMKKCREYQPDLVLLNHRLELGIGNPYATTFLWEGLETYIDVHVSNNCTAPHHRAYFLFRNRVPGLTRLAEDHGVCISSCPDYFEDDLIFQAFNRCLILSPEIYGNPWFLRDDEQAKLAHIYNLHARYADILVHGGELPEEYTKNSTFRGDGTRQFFTLGNPTWETRYIRVRLDDSIGLKKCEKTAVKIHHPYTSFLGIFAWGESIDIPVMPFRAALIEARDASLGGEELKGAEYEVLHETDAGEDEIKIVSSDGGVCLIDSATGETLRRFEDIGSFDYTMRAPKLIGELSACEADGAMEARTEATLFAADNDSLEIRALRRSGKTKIQQVQAARDAFFSQKRYVLRGCEGRFAFDGRDDTWFDGLSKTEFGGQRIKGGCLRVDFGDIFNAKGVAIEYFSPDTETNISRLQSVTETGSFSRDLYHWGTARLSETKVTVPECTVEAVFSKVHNIVNLTGCRRRTMYALNGDIRYFRLPCPVDRIFKIALIACDGTEIPTPHARVNNLFASYALSPAMAMKCGKVTISAEDYREGCYLSIALDGKTAPESAYAGAEIDGRLIGCPDRSVSYPSNLWECPTREGRGYYTYYLPVEKEYIGKEIEIYVTFTDDGNSDIPCRVYLCDANNEKPGKTLRLS